MLKKNGNRGSRLIAMVIVVVALAAGPVAGGAFITGFSPDASWAEGA
jgi:hypothetical protein